MSVSSEVPSEIFFFCFGYRDISSIGTTFSHNNVITTILELEYFVNVKSLASGAFRSCQSLIEVRLDNITSIANSNVFRDCYSLKELVFKNLVSDVTQSNVGYYNYRGTRKLKFIRYDKVTTITQYRYDAMTPVFIITHSDSVCSITSGSGMPAALYVPDSMVESYKSASVWSNMASKIYPISQFSSDYPDSDILDK